MPANAHILIVEDEEHLAAGIKYNLVAEGYRVTTAVDGPTALRILEASPGAIDLIVLDLMLPGMSGYAVCEALRDADREMPVLILAARTLAEDRTRGFDVGANQYMTKPFELDEFLSRVRNLLTFHRRQVGEPRRQSAAGGRVRVRRGEDQLRDLRRERQRRAGPADAVGDEPAAVFRRERGPGDSPPRIVGERLGDAGHVEHAGAGPVHSSSAEALRARSRGAAAFLDDPRRRVSVCRRGGDGTGEKGSRRTGERMSGQRR